MGLGQTFRVSTPGVGAGVVGAGVGAGVAGVGAGVGEGVAPTCIWGREQWSRSTVWTPTSVCKNACTTVRPGYINYNLELLLNYAFKIF